MEITLNKIFADYVQDVDFVDSEDYAKSVIVLDAFLDTKISLDQKLKSELQDLIGESQYISQEQGFINGFKYAMSLIKECGLK